MERLYPMVELTPDENIPVTVNGVRYDLFADKPCKVPSIIRDTYIEHRRLNRQTKTITNEMGALVNLGVGGDKEN